MRHEAIAESNRMALESIVIGSKVSLSTDGGRTWNAPRQVTSIRSRGESARGVPSLSLTLEDDVRLVIRADELGISASAA